MITFRSLLASPSIPSGLSHFVNLTRIEEPYHLYTAYKQQRAGLHIKSRFFTQPSTPLPSIWAKSSSLLHRFSFSPEMWTLGRLHRLAVRLSLPNTSTSWPFQFTMSIMPIQTHTASMYSTVSHTHAGKVGVNHPCMESQMSPGFDILFAHCLKGKKLACLSLSALSSSSFHSYMICTRHLFRL